MGAIYRCVLSDALAEMSSIRQVSLDCSQYAVAALCYSAFPPCSGDVDRQVLSTSRRRPLGICRDHCKHLLDVACRDEYKYAQRTPMRFGTTATSSFREYVFYVFFGFKKTRFYFFQLTFQKRKKSSAKVYLKN